jgi:hypothetical protein
MRRNGPEYHALQALTFFSARFRACFTFVVTTTGDRSARRQSDGRGTPPAPSRRQVDQEGRSKPVWYRRPDVGTRPDTDFVFNIVWTQDVYRSLQYFVSSLMGQSGARFRYIANACSPDAVDAMRQFAASHPDRVVEVLEVAGADDAMLTHGSALDLVFDTRDDGDFFCFVDADIKARGPFMEEFKEQLESAAAVTSGKGVWTESSVLPEGQIGVSGEYFFSQEGYVFGSPHLALYRRDALADTRQRWGIELTNGGPDFSDAIEARLVEVGQKYWVYDTAKVTNILLQEDGHPICHFEHPQIMHIGGLSHFLAPHHWIEHDDGTRDPHWVVWDRMEARHEVARYTAGVLQATIARQPPPPVPSDLDDSLAERLRMVREEIVDLVETYRSF